MLRMVFVVRGNQHFAILVAVDNINVVGASLQDFLDATEVSLVGDHSQADQLEEIVLVVTQGGSLVTADKDTKATQLFGIVSVAAAFKS